MKMKKRWIAVFTAIIAAATGFAEEKTIAEWDFTKGGVNSVDGKFTAALRGKSRIAGNAEKGFYLSVGKSKNNVQEGVVTSRIYPELTPGGKFRLEAVFHVNEQTSPAPYLFIWDSKNITYGPNDPNAKFHHGFVVLLIRQKDNTFYPIAWIGHGTYSSSYVGNTFTLEEGKTSTLSFEYDGIGKGFFLLDGKPVTMRPRKEKKAGAVSPAIFQTAIGDRTGSEPYFRFDGDIFNVKLIGIR